MIPSPASTDSLSRRDFLKLGSLGIFGLFLPATTYGQSIPSDQQGRVLDPEISVYTVPSFSGRKIKSLYKDMVLPITEATVGDEQPAHNRFWYQVGGEGYVHSGVIQPVKTQLNPVVSQVPATGQLAEVTVPFTDAYWGPGLNYPLAYRFYYATTYWVNAIIQGKGDDVWYRVLDDRLNHHNYYVRAPHLRLIPAAELAPLSTHLPPQAKRIEVHLTEQTVIAYEKDQPVFMARVSTGAEFSNGKFHTPAGKHQTFHKRPSRHMAAGNLAANGYDLPGVPWIAYFTESGAAFHGTYWHNDFGKPRSHGCINLTPQAARWIYRWTLPIVPPDQESLYENYGTVVDIFA